MKKRSLLVCISVILSVMMLWIGGNPSIGFGQSSSEANIVLAAPRDLVPGEHDFHYASVICSVWEPLVAVDTGWNPVPGLAQSWERSEDAREWTFHLRRDVTFHDGEPFNADAVIANFARYQKLSPAKSRFYTFRMERFYPGFKDIEKLDDYTVKLIFEKPLPTLVYYMTNFGSPMFSPTCFDAEGQFVATAAGTGPFKVAKHVPNQYVILERFEDYYGKKARAEYVRINVIPDGNTRFSALRSEEILGTLDLGAIQPNLARELLKEDRFRASVTKSPIIHYLAPNGTKFPFNDLRMRQAVSLIIDRQLIADEFYAGYPDPAAHILNYASPFYQDLPVKHDPALAKKLAKEVLSDRQVKIDLLIPSPFVKKFPYKEQGEYIQAVLGELGLQVEIKMMEFGALREAMKKGSYDLCMRIQGLPNGEPFSIFNSFMRTNAGQNKSYSLGYSNPEVDSLLNTLEQTLDMKERANIYRQLQAISAAELPFIPLINDVTLIVHNTRITGYEAMIYGVTLPALQWAE